MYSNIDQLAGPHCRREDRGVIEERADDLLVIHDMPLSAYRKALLWIMAGFIPVITAIGVVTIQHFPSVLMLSFVLLSAIAFMARRTTTEISLADRMIRRKWKIGILSWHRVYPLEDRVTAEIREEGQMIEGYPLPLFSVRLAGRERHIALYSTDDAEDAASMCGTMNCFLGKAGISTRQQ